MRSGKPLLFSCLFVYNDSDMKSLRELLVIGPGPSSSHTIGPFRIVKDFVKDLSPEEIDRIDVTLFGSLAFTGKGHRTDDIIREALLRFKTEVIFDLKTKELAHPNTMELVAYRKGGTVKRGRYLSLGGGAYCLEGENPDSKDIYPFTTFDGLTRYAKEHGISDCYEIIEQIEGNNIFDFGKKMLLHSFMTLENALNQEGYLPGPLHLEAVSKKIYQTALQHCEESERLNLLLSAFAYATAEANARGEMIVTAPTCGAAGVVPAVLYYFYRTQNKSIEELTKSYLVGALVCNFIKENASVSGALLGCQAEIGSASSFASSSLAYLNHLSLHKIEYAAEVSMEHFLGLTCDPVNGYVQIPCIERNGMAAIHAYTAYLYAKDISLFRQNKVSFDKVVEAMKVTGNEIPSDLKETSLGGLAKVIGS